MQWNYFINHFPTAARQQQDSKFTWQTPSGDYYSGPDPPASSQPLGVLYPRAGTLGGCATHNALVTIYAHDSDWEYIQNLTRDSSWAPDRMRKYFEKLESNEYLTHHTSGHGRNGWLGTSVLDESLLVQDPKIMCHAAAAAGVINNRTVEAAPTTVKELQKIIIADPNKPGQDDKEGLYSFLLQSRMVYAAVQETSS
jgi:choline dehydrogenase